MRWILLVLVAVTLTMVGGLLALNAGLLHPYIQRQVHEKAGMDLQLGPVRLALNWPVQITVGRSEIQGQGVWAQWESLVIAIDRLASPQKFRVTWVGPRVNMQMAAPQGKAARSAPRAAGAGASGRVVAPVDLELWIKDGHFSLPAVKLDAVNLYFAQKQLMLSPAKLNVQAHLNASVMPGAMPVSIKTDDLTFSADKVKTGKLVALIGGLIADIQGTSLLSEDRHRWVLSITAPDLAKVAQPTENMPVRLQAGSLQIKGEVTKDGPTRAWAADAKLSARAVTARADWKNQTAAVNGVAEANLNAHVIYQDGVARAPFVNGDLNLGAAQVSVADYLEKPSDVPMKVSFDAVATRTGMNLRSLNWQLDRLTGIVQGLVDTAAPHKSSLRFKIDQTSLDGLEKLIPPLRASPLVGQVELDMAFNGELLKPMSGDIHVARLDVRRLRGAVDYKREGAFAVKGPLRLNLESSLRQKDGRLVFVSATGEVDLQAAELSAGPLIKTPNQPFAASFNVRTQGESAIRIQGAQLRSGFAQVSLAGEVKPAAAPDLDLQVNLTRLDLAGLGASLPSFKDKIPAGLVSGTLKIKGNLTSQSEWYRWPLATDGAVNVVLPHYEFAAATPPADQAGAGSGPAPVTSPTAFLPRGLLTEQARLNLVVAVNRVKKDGLEFGPLNARAVAGYGRLTRGEVKIQNLFGGQLDIAGMETSLFDASPTLKGAAQWDSIDVEQALAFAKPTAKDLAAGRTKGNVEFTSLLPADGRFLSQLKVNGKAAMDPARLNTVIVGQMINQQLEKLPVKVAPVKVEPMNGRLEMDFDLQSQTMNIGRLLAVDKNQSQLEVKGKILLPDLHGDLMGNLALTNPPLSGCMLEGNADGQGRMVIPIGIKGDLMKPGLTIVSDIFAKLAGRAFECEKRKLVDRARQEGQKAVEKELKNAVKGLFGK